MNKRRILWLVLVLFIVGLVIGYYLWNKAPENQVAGKPDFEKNLNEWVAELNADTGAARTFSAFVGKSVKFSGEVVDVMGDSSLTLQIKTGVEGFNLNASFHQDYQSTVSGILAGDVVTLQCICDGLMVPMSADDLFAEKKIDMSRCTLLKHEPHKADVSKSVELEQTDSNQLNN
ncbi:MAG: hypothetical protein FJX91_08315 [Bacteroidetes bacterium]|nr:hypothetical protein [Bacteroidota bacterium]